MSSMLENVDVAMFFNKTDRVKAAAIMSELGQLTKKGGESLKLASYDDLPLGQPKTKSRIMLTKSARVICLIATCDFGKDTWNEFEAEISSHEKVESRKPKVIYVQLCKTKDVTVDLQHLTGIDGIDKSDKDIAAKIKQHHDFIAKKETFLQIIPLNRLKLYLVIDAATDAISKHFGIDEKMTELHSNVKSIIQGKLPPTAQRKEKIIVQTTQEIGCDCTEGELWKEEIHEKKYWSTNPTPYRNCSPFKKDKQNKHTDDIHNLFCGNGPDHVALASVFLSKKQFNVKEPSQCSNILECLDTDSVITLLKTCTVFNLKENGKKAIEKVHLARHYVSHIPQKNFGPDDQIVALDSVIKAARSLYGIVLSEVWGNLERKIEQIKRMTIEARVEEVNERVVNDFQGKPCETNCPETPDSLLQQLNAALATTNLAGPQPPATVTPSTASTSTTFGSSADPNINSNSRSGRNKISRNNNVSCTSTATTVPPSTSVTKTSIMGAPLAEPSSILVKNVTSIMGAPIAEPSSTLVTNATTLMGTPEAESKIATQMTETILARTTASATTTATVLTTPTPTSTVMAASSATSTINNVDNHQQQSALGTKSSTLNESIAEFDVEETLTPVSVRPSEDDGDADGGDVGSEGGAFAAGDDGVECAVRPSEDGDDADGAADVKSGGGLGASVDDYGAGGGLLGAAFPSPMLVSDSTSRLSIEMARLQVEKERLKVEKAQLLFKTSENNLKIANLNSNSQRQMFPNNIVLTVLLLTAITIYLFSKYFT